MTTSNTEFAELLRDPAFEGSCNTLEPFVLFEHPRFFAIHKPKGVNFHDEKNNKGILNRGLVSRVSDLLSEEKLYPVHRLDRVTSGIMLFARDEESLSTLSQMFERHRISKTYLALTEHKPSSKVGELCGDMKKQRGGAWVLTRETTRPAITRFVSCSLYPELKKHWLLCLYPKTGKTHQLRVAAKALGAPIKGDKRYGSCEADRVYLHAFRLKFRFGQDDFDLVDPYFSGQVCSEGLLTTLIQYGLTGNKIKKNLSCKN